MIVLIVYVYMPKYSSGGEAMSCETLTMEKRKFF